MTQTHPPNHPKCMPWKVSTRMLDDIRVKDPELYREIEKTTGGDVLKVVDDRLFAQTDLPEDGGLRFTRDYAYEALQVWRQRTGRLDPNAESISARPERSRPEDWPEGLAYLM